MIVVGAAIAAGVIASVWRGLLHPFGQLNEAVAAVADGRYQQVVPTVGPAELADLSRGVELMRTRLVDALAERERAEQNLRNLFDLMPDAVLGVARGGAIVTANAQALQTFGYQASELCGRRVETLVPEDLRADLAARTACYFADPQSRAQWNATTWSMLRSDGTAFPCGVRMSTLPTDDGTLIIVAVRDATERVAIEAERERLRTAAEEDRLQQRLRQFQRLESLGQLVSGVAHDFNNLLGIISGYAEYTVEQLQPLAKEDARLVPLIQDIEQVQSAAQQAIRVTRQLLTFAKSKPASTELLDVNEVVNSAGQLLRRSLGAKIELVIAADADLWPVEADRGQLEQVLVNLALNARDAMPDGGRLTITTANAEVDAVFAGQRPNLRPGRYCRLVVADTGTGMDHATLERVFEPFFSTKPRGRGTGLGLATVYGIVSGLGGIVDISSEVGLGTTMNVLLPVSGEAVAAVPQPSPPAEEAHGHGEVILLVEDEQGLRSMASRILARNGYVVHEAADGAAAVRLANDPGERIDLLLTDILMPGMTGNEVADRVRALRPGLPALFITGHAQQALDFHGIPAPDLDIVQKPFTEAVLLSRVHRALGAARHGAPT
jgi:PAS domain S-box-containing protein